MILVHAFSSTCAELKLTVGWPDYGNACPETELVLPTQNASYSKVVNLSRELFYNIIKKSRQNSTQVLVFSGWYEIYLALFFSSFCR